MTRRASLLGVCVASAVACSPSPQTAAPAITIGPPTAAEPRPAPTFLDSDRVHKLTAARPAVEAYLRQIAGTENIPGLAVAVVAIGAPTWSLGVGATDLDGKTPVNAGTVFRIGSLTKVFTAMAVLRLVEEGQLSLDDPAQKHVPELGEHVGPTTDSRPFTIRDLLTHSAGLVPGGGYGGRQQPAARDTVLAAAASRGPPGEPVRYSNVGFAVLGLVLEAVTGAPGTESITDLIVAPLGLRSASWSAPGETATGYRRMSNELVPQAPRDLGAEAPAGGMYASLEDVAAIAALQLQAWPPRDGADDGTLKRATLRESQRVARLLPPGSAELPRLPTASAAGTGLGWQVYRDCRFGPVVWHSGATEGFAAALYMLPRHGVAVVLLANLHDAPVRDMAHRLLEILDTEANLTPRSMKPAPSLVAALETADVLLSSWDDARFSESFAPRFSADAVRKLTERASREWGACVREELVASSPFEATVPLRCGRGRLELRVRTGGPQQRIDRFELRPLAACPRTGESGQAGRI